MEAARQRDEGGEAEAEAEPSASVEIPDMFPVSKSGAPVAGRQAAAPNVELPQSVARLEEPEPEAPLPAETSRPRTDELLVCSLQGEVLHEWKCSNPNGRVGFLEFVSQKARQLAQ